MMAQSLHIAPPLTSLDEHHLGTRYSADDCLPCSEEEVAGGSARTQDKSAWDWTNGSICCPGVCPRTLQGALQRCSWISGAASPFEQHIARHLDASCRSVLCPTTTKSLGAR